MARIFHGIYIPAAGLTLGLGLFSYFNVAMLRIHHMLHYAFHSVAVILIGYAIFINYNST